MRISDLKPAQFNPRKISDKALKSLKKAMVEFGDLSGIVYNVRTKRVVGGHQRLKHLDPSWTIEKNPHKDKVGTVAVGHIETPFGSWQYREVDWPEKKELSANIAANKHGGEWDFPKLKDILVELDDGDFDLGLTGFDGEELKDLIEYDPPDSEDFPFDDNTPMAEITIRGAPERLTGICIDEIRGLCKKHGLAFVNG